MRDFDRNISVKEMQIQDKNSSDYGISPSTLMECAGFSAAQTIRKTLIKKGDHVTIVCGTGNNGGDGFVIARHLLAEHIQVTLILVGHPEHIRTSEAKQNWDILQSLLMNLHVYVAKDSSFFNEISKDAESWLKKSKVIVDCLLGTGIRGNVREPIRSAIQFVNSFSDKSTKIVSIDVPSGVDPNTGNKADYWVNPNVLITFHREKTGFNKIDVPKLIVNSIGIPMEADLFVGSGDLKFLLPKRTEKNHKGQYGKVLIIGGSKQYSGAPALSGMAALQMGMDLVYVFAPKSVADVIRSYSPNLIVRSGRQDNICEKDLPEIQELIERVDAVVIGPGLGTAPGLEKTISGIITYLKTHKKPLVIDADAIRLSKLFKSELKSLNVIFTPHANEFYELVNKKLPDQEDFQKRIKFIEKTVKEWDLTFLIKGRYDYISDGKSTRINKTGVPEMAVGGTGDILTGVLVSLLSLKISLFDAACCAAYVNGKLGEFYQIYQKGKNKNGSPLKSSDLLEYIPIVLKQDT